MKFGYSRRGKVHSHIGENVGSTDTHVLIVELK